MTVDAESNLRKLAIKICYYCYGSDRMTSDVDWVESMLCSHFATSRAVAEAMEQAAVAAETCPEGEEKFAMGRANAAAAVRSLSPIPNYADRLRLEAKVEEVAGILNDLEKGGAAENVTAYLYYVKADLTRELAEKGGPIA